jgi:hypothetical protein
MGEILVLSYTYTAAIYIALCLEASLWSSIYTRRIVRRLTNFHCVLQVCVCLVASVSGRTMCR